MTLGWLSMSAQDWEDALKFRELAGKRPLVEEFLLELAAAAYDHMENGKARFGVVLSMS